MGAAGKPAAPDGAAKAGCFGPPAEPEEVPVSINDLLETTPSAERGGAGAVARPRHPDDHRSAFVRGCCADGVCCRDGRCCFCEGRLPRGNECLRWWLTYAPGLTAIRDLQRAGNCGHPARLCGGLCLCSALTLAFYACPCAPAALCGFRVKDTLLQRRAVWGPFCDDAASLDRETPQYNHPEFMNCIPEMCQDGVDREEGWQPRTRWWQQRREPPAAAAAAAAAPPAAGPGRGPGRPAEGGGRGGSAAGASGSPSPSGAGPSPSTSPGSQQGARGGAAAASDGPSYFPATRRESLLRISAAAAVEEASRGHAGGGGGASPGDASRRDQPRGSPVDRPPAIVAMDPR